MGRGFSAVLWFWFWFRGVGNSGTEQGPLRDKSRWGRRQKRKHFKFCKKRSRGRKERWMVMVMGEREAGGLGVSPSGREARRGGPTRQRPVDMDEGPSSGLHGCSMGISWHGGHPGWAPFGRAGPSQDPHWPSRDRPESQATHAMDRRGRRRGRGRGDGGSEGRLRVRIVD
jgi:hypothetical protein